jgi:hypothetical protein
MPAQPGRGGLRRDILELVMPAAPAQRIHAKQGEDPAALILGYPAMHQLVHARVDLGPDLADHPVQRRVARQLTVGLDQLLQCEVDQVRRIVLGLGGCPDRLGGDLPAVA